MCLNYAILTNPVYGFWTLIYAFGVVFKANLMVRSQLIYILYFWNSKFAIYLIPSKNQPFTFLVRDSFIKIIIKLGSSACLRARGTTPPCSFVVN